MAESVAESAAPGEFFIEEERPASGVVLLAARGDADLHVALELQDRLDEAIDDGASTLVVDLGGLTFLDSSALGVLLRGMKRLQSRGGQLRIVAPRADIRRIFEMTRLDSVFELVATRERALRGTRTSLGAAG
jgi:anti-sigma B factor antagonist